MGSAVMDTMPSTSMQERIEYVIDLRRRFSPPGMLNEDGSVKQEFFKPKGVVIVNDKHWGAEERELLYKGLEKYGIGKWHEIAEEFLPNWEDQQIRIKASRLMGSQSLAKYVGWKGNKEAVENEFAKNKQIGEATGCWKSGVLVEDDNGTVKKYLEQMNAA